MRERQNSQHEEVTGEKIIDVFLREKLKEDVKAEKGAGGDNLK